MVTIVFALWYAGVGAKALAAYRMARKGLITRFAPVWVFIVVSVLRSCLLTLHQTRQGSYESFYSYSMPFMLLLEAFAIVGTFWAVTENYPNFRTAGAFFLAVLSLLGAAAAWLVRFTAVPQGWDDLWQLATLLQRNVLLVMITVLVGTRVFLPRFRGIPIRQSAQRAADTMTCQVAVGLLTSAFAIATGARYAQIGSLIPVVGGILNGLLWAFWLPAASDVCPEMQLRPAEELEEAYEASLGRQNEIFKDIRNFRRELQQG